ncbi:MAG TPA: glycine zipper domain-containing protein [Sphingomicrobium sp.]|nr:glycine zipper domain-containing protein [Sphingomicrobium sp.]
MKRLALAAVAGSIALTGCATNPYGYGYDPYYGNQGYYYDSQGRRIATGAAAGAVGGAAIGAVVPGVSPVEGAIAGAVLGGVLGAVINNRQYYRDTRGYCYWVDQYGRPHYDYNVRC